MQPWQQRVVDEKRELDERLEKLTAFIASPAMHPLDEADCHLLRCQREAMWQYSGVLQRRIERFAS